MKKLLVSILSVLMALALAMPIVAEGDTADVTTIEELNNALENQDVKIININKQLEYSVEVTLDFTGKTVNVTIPDDAQSYEQSAFVFHENGTIKNLALKSTNEKMKYGVHGYKDITLENVSISDYIYAGVNVNGGKLIASNLSASSAKGGYAAVELAMGSGVTTVPTIDESSTISGAPVYADIKQISAALGADETKVNGVIEQIKKVAESNGITYAYKDTNGSVVSDTVEISSIDELKKAIENEGVKYIVLKNKIVISDEENANLDFKDKTLILASGDKALEFSNLENASVSNVTIKQSGTSMKYGIHAYLTDITLTNVTVEEPNYAGVLVNGSNLSASDYVYVASDSSYAAVELAMGINVTEVPKIDENSTISGGPVYADVKQINESTSLTDEQRAQIVSQVETNLIAVAKKNNIEAFTNGGEGGTTKPLPVTPDPTPSKPSNPSRPSSPSKDLPSNTEECQKEFGKDYIYSKDLDACIIKYLVVDTSTK